MLIESTYFFPSVLAFEFQEFIFLGVITLNFLANFLEIVFTGKRLKIQVSSGVAAGFEKSLTLDLNHLAYKVHPDLDTNTCNIFECYQMLDLAK